MAPKKKTRKRGGVWNPIKAMKEKKLTKEIMVALEVPPNREKTTAILRNPDFNVNRIYASSYTDTTPLMKVVFGAINYSAHRQTYLDILDEILAIPTIDVSYPSVPDNDNALSDAIYYKDDEIIQKLISKLKPTPNNAFYIFVLLKYASTYDDEIRILPLIHALLQKGIIVEEFRVRPTVVMEQARTKGFDYVIQLLETGIMPIIPQNNTVNNTDSKPWTGFSRADIDFTNNVFHQSVHPVSLSYSNPEESLFSICPVCLKHIQHASGSCMYMTHSCVDQAGYEGYYHKKLWKAFSYLKEYNDRGQLMPISQRKRVVEWCTHCGRICKGHKHYKKSTELYNPNGTVIIPDLAIGDDYFATTCATPKIGGGGTPEKIARYRKFREMVLELNKPEYVGKISYIEAINKLVEAVWQSPRSANPETLAYIEREKQFNAPVANTLFPLHSELTASNANTTDPTYPNVNNPELLPVVFPRATETMKNAMEHLSGDEENIVQFRHRMSDGVINTHSAVNQQIALDRLMDYLSDLSIKQDSEHYGMCWQHEPLNYTEVYDPEHKPNQCTARMYPEEVLHAIDHATYDTEEHKKRHMQIYNAYRVGFANKFRGVRGGKQTRKLRRR